MRKIKRKRKDWRNNFDTALVVGRPLGGSAPLQLPNDFRGNILFGARDRTRTCTPYGKGF